MSHSKITPHLSQPARWEKEAIDHRKRRGLVSRQIIVTQIIMVLRRVLFLTAFFLLPACAMRPAPIVIPGPLATLAAANAHALMLAEIEKIVEEEKKLSKQAMPMHIIFRHCGHAFHDTLKTQRFCIDWHLWNLRWSNGLQYEIVGDNDYVQ